MLNASIAMRDIKAGRAASMVTGYPTRNRDTVTLISNSYRYR